MGYSDGDALPASPINFSEADRYNKVYANTIGIMTGLLAGTGTKLCGYNGAASSVSTDSGATWSACAADVAGMQGVGVSCDANKALMIVFDTGDANTFISSDSGDNWAAAAADPGGTRVWCASFPTASVAVCGMDEGTVRDIYYSTDSGNNWTVCDTGPTEDVIAIDMVDGSDGIAIDVSGNIWTTSNGGVDWTDSGQNIVGTTNLAGSIQTSMIALTASTYVMVNANEGTNTVQTGTTGAGGTQRYGLYQITIKVKSEPSNLVKTNNGNLYFAVHRYGDSDAQAEMPLATILFKSEDSGVTWAAMELPCAFGADSTGISTPSSAAVLQETSNNNLILMDGGINMIAIDESGA